MSFFLVSVSVGCAFAQNSIADKSTATFNEYLAQEKAYLAASVHNTQQWIEPKNEREYTAQTDQVSYLLKVTQIKIENLFSFLDQQNKEQIALNQRLKLLQQLPVAKEGASIPERVAKVEDMLEANVQTIQLINEDLALAKEFQTALNNESRQLELWHERFALEQKLLEIKARKGKLRRDLDQLYQKNFKPVEKGEINPAGIVAADINYEAKMLVNNQNIAAIQYQINALNVQKIVVKRDITYLKNSDTKNLQMLAETYRDALAQYTKIGKSMQRLLANLNKEKRVLSIPGLKKIVTGLQNTIEQYIEEINGHKEILTKDLTEYEAKLKQLISSRQTLADYNINSWPIILKKIAAIPGLFYKYLYTLGLKIYDSYTWLDTWSAALLWGSFSVITGLFYLLNRFLKSLRRDKERSRLAGYLYDGFLVLIQRNIPYLCIASMLWILLNITHISFANYQLLFNLFVVWLTFRVVILIARMVLLESISDVSGKDVKLYYRLKWLLLFGGWTTALMTIGHLLPLSLLVQDIFNRLFMLFLLTVSLVSWKSGEVIRYLVHPLLENKKRYVSTAISLLIVLVPITVLSTAFIGLSGFINLAWTMSRYQANALTVLIGYILARGLLFDALEFFSEWMISSLRNGWLWIEVFLKPIDKLLRVVLILASALVLFQLYGWNSDSMVIVSLEKMAQYTILNVPGIHITVASSVAFFTLLALFVWAAKWTREFCYRWLFSNTKDAGIRNSLSVFSQYTVVLVGSFVTLHVLGFDFSGMSMIIGGLAVGMGFGLRDFASNIVGGIMLLIERPVRVGDLITIGEHEGQVEHIGIRAMRICSWDNMEVLVPNAETFNKPFTNWTHKDGIVRSVVPIKVSRIDDPVMIQQLILDVLALIPEIVSEPPAQVFLKKIDEALVVFEARYYINVEIHSRFEVQSNVLFAIMAQFKAANIKPPIEPIAIELKDKYGEFTIKNHATQE